MPSPDRLARPDTAARHHEAQAYLFFCSLSYLETNWRNHRCKNTSGQVGDTRNLRGTRQLNLPADKAPAYIHT
jgi:hypothetical protein